MYHLVSRLLPFILTLISVTPPLFAQGNQALVEKVRFCTSNVICFGHTQSEYRYWADHNVAPEKQKRTFISRYVEPARHHVEHLVFISSGQRIGDSIHNLLTGQEENFHTSFSSRDEEEWETIDTRSIAFRLFDEGVRSPLDTFAALAFDARFNFDFTANNKREIVNAYYDWLKSKFIAANLKSIYLVGHSRGGALVLHLAERFNRDFPQIPMIIHLFDAVLHHNQGELGVLNSKIDSPLRDDNGPTRGYENYIFDFRRLLRNQDALRIYNFVSGDLASDILGLNLLDIHSTS